MARLDQRLATNVAGDFYVDATCIDCGTCRWMAPDVFDEVGGRTRVHSQPDPGRTLRAEMALLACPTGSIGTVEKHDLAGARGAFPDPIDGPVYHLGYHSDRSFGAVAYLIRRPAGNIMVDSPRFAGQVVRALEALGGFAWMFLSHRDDVADHARYAAHFGCRRILHRADIGAGTRDVEWQLDGSDPVALDDDVVLIPVPGHTRGSVCLLYDDCFLFTGDHAAWSIAAGEVTAFRDVCWYDWAAQTRSMARLADYRFEWLLPGHGAGVHLPAAVMAGQLAHCIERMRGH